MSTPRKVLQDPIYEQVEVRGLWPLAWIAGGIVFKLRTIELEALDKFHLLISDGIFFISVVLLILFQSLAKSLITKIVCIALSILLSFWYFFDAVAQGLFGHRFFYQIIGEYREEWFLALQFFNWERFLFLATMIVLSLFLHRTRQVPRVPIFALGLSLLLSFSFPFIMPPTKAGASTHQFLAQFVNPAEWAASPYTSEEIESFQAKKERNLPHDFFELKEAPNIILLIVESLSTRDWKRAGGFRDLYPRMEVLARKGRLFTNFYAQHTYSEAALVSLLWGNPALSFYGYPDSILDGYKHQASLVDQLNAFGYDTSFITAHSLDFYHHGDFARSCGFQNVLGLGQVERFRNVQHQSSMGPADEYLFQEIVSQADSRPNPYFLTAMTLSTHPPFFDPLKRENSEQEVWNYFDKEFEKFYRSLDKADFFSNGILIVVGDHRSFAPHEKNEIEKFGPGFTARVPLILFGRGVEPGRDNRLFQQSDLLSMLPKAIHGGRKLSSLVLHSPLLFGRLYSAAEPNLVTVSELQGKLVYGEALTVGSNIIWMRLPPESLQKIQEREIHSFRSQGQASYFDHLKEHDKLK